MEKFRKSGTCFSGLSAVDVIFAPLIVNLPLIHVQATPIIMADR